MSYYDPGRGQMVHPQRSLADDAMFTFTLYMAARAIQDLILERGKR